MVNSNSDTESGASTCDDADANSDEDCYSDRTDNESGESKSCGNSIYRSYQLPAEKLLDDQLDTGRLIQHTTLHSRSGKCASNTPVCMKFKVEMKAPRLKKTWLWDILQLHMPGEPNEGDEERELYEENCDQLLRIFEEFKCQREDDGHYRAYEDEMAFQYGYDPPETYWAKYQHGLEDWSSNYAKRHAFYLKCKGDGEYRW